MDFVEEVDVVLGEVDVDLKKVNIFQGEGLLCEKQMLFLEQLRWIFEK